MSPQRTHVFVAGASGFVGRALCPALTAAGHRVTRGLRPAFDVDDDASVRAALEDIDVAYWLVHGLKRGADYPAWERDAAERFARNAKAARVDRVIYLGGLEPKDAHGARVTTKHLQSRLDTGAALRSAMDVVELRAGMIVGAGSESWTLARDASARLPAFVAPRWLEARQQPVALDDVVAALVAAVSLPPAIYGVPGPEVLTGREIVQRTTRILGRSAPRFIPLPVFPRRLAARIAPYVSRANGAVARELFSGMGLDLTLEGAGVFAHMPGHRRAPFDEAATRALAADDVSFSAQLYEGLLRRVL